MAVKTTKTLLEQINDALMGKIVYWVYKDTLHYGVIIWISGDEVVVDQNLLPNTLRPDTIGMEPFDHIQILGLDQAMLGIYESVSLN